MSFDAWIVGFGLSALLKELGLVESNLAFLVLVGVGLLDTYLLYWFFTVQLPMVKRTEALGRGSPPVAPAPATASPPLRVT
jgi:hypothetical protein